MADAVPRSFAQRARRWGWRLIRVVAAVTLLLAVVARVQLGLPPRADEGWRTRVRAAALVPPAAVVRGARWVRRFRIPSEHGAVCDLASTPLIAHEGRLWAASTRTGEVSSFEPR